MLLAVAKLCPGPSDLEFAAELISLGLVSWEHLLEIASEHWVCPLLAHNLLGSEMLHELLPSHVKAKLRAAQFMAEQRINEFVRAVGPPIRALADEGIPVMLMKGVTLTQCLYPRGSRLLNDIDLLIGQVDYDRVACVLEEFGFCRVPNKDWSETMQRRCYHQMLFVYRSATAQPHVDLHWLMYPRNRRFFIENKSLFAGSRQVCFDGVTVRSYSLENAFVHYATQLVNDGVTTSYLRLVDLHGLARSGLEWDRLCLIATEASAEVPTYIALRIAEMLGAPVPGTAYSSFERMSLENRLVASFLADPRFAFSDARPSLREGVLIPLTHTKKRDQIASLRSFLVHCNANDGRRLRKYLGFAFCALLFAASTASLSLRARSIGRRLAEPLWVRRQSGNST